MSSTHYPKRHEHILPRSVGENLHLQSCCVLFSVSKAFNDNVRAMKIYFKTKHTKYAINDMMHITADVYNEISDDKTICRQCQNQWPLKIHQKMTQYCPKGKMVFYRAQNKQTHTLALLYSSRSIWIPILVRFYYFYVSYGSNLCLTSFTMSKEHPKNTQRNNTIVTIRWIVSAPLPMIFFPTIYIL